jgi:hypothetical protein
MNHKIGPRRALLALLGSGIGLTGVLRLAVAQQPLAQGLRRFRGDVRINDKPAESGTPVRPGDTITTGRGGLAIYVVGQDAYLMRENSRAELTGPELLVSVLRLFTGKLLAVFGPGQDRRVVTTTATMGIRGTGAYWEAEERRTYFCLCYGTAEVGVTGSSQSETYSTAHHESPKYIYGDGRQDAVVSAPVINHTDSELIMLEGLVGRRPPPNFMQSPFRY